MVYGIKKKNLHKAVFSAMEEKLYHWFIKQRDRNCPLNGTLLKAKAKGIYEKIGTTENASFSASDGWPTSRNAKESAFLQFVERSYPQMLQQ